MSIYIRRLILFIFILAFIILAPILILFYSGYQWDWRKNKIVKTGAFLIESNPKNALIYLNGKLQKKKTPALINNLLPDEYLIEIKKPNYYSWQKLLNIESKKVTFAQDIQLFLKDADLRKSSTQIYADQLYPEIQRITETAVDLFENNRVKPENIKGFSFSPDKEKILWWTNFELWIYNLETKNQELLARYSKEIIDVLWHPKNNWIIFAFSNSIQAIELDERDGKNVVELIEVERVENLLIMEKKELWFRGKIEGEEGMFRVRVQ